MASEPNEQAEWRECPRGEVSTMVGRIRSRRRRVFAVQIGGCAAFGLLLGIAFVQLRPTFAPTPVQGEISCREVRHHAELFIKGTLDGDLQDRIAVHLKVCPSCDRYVEKKRSTDGSQQRPSSEQRTAALSRRLPLAADF